MGKANLASKIRKLGLESEYLWDLVDNTAQTTDRSTQNISNRVSELVHQVIKTNMRSKIMLRIIGKEHFDAVIFFKRLDFFNANVCVLNTKFGKPNSCPHSTPPPNHPFSGPQICYFRDSMQHVGTRIYFTLVITLGDDIKL